MVNYPYNVLVKWNDGQLMRYGFLSIEGANKWLQTNMNLLTVEQKNW